jgi:DNA-binding protein YbaB
MAIDDSDAELQTMQQELDRARDLADDIRERGERAEHKASPKNKMLTVTVGGRGEVRDISFRGNAYRSLAPAELGKLLVETIEEARAQAYSQAMAAIAEISPTSAMPLDLMKPAATMSDMMDNLLEVAAQSMHNTHPDDIPRRGLS